MVYEWPIMIIQANVIHSLNNTYYSLIKETLYIIIVSRTFSVKWRIGMRYRFCSNFIPTAFLEHHLSSSTTISDGNGHTFCRHEHFWHALFQIFRARAKRAMPIPESSGSGIELSGTGIKRALFGWTFWHSSYTRALVSILKVGRSIFFLAR